MSNFRQSLYERYYSTFKNSTKREGLALWHLMRWHHEKYDPIFKPLDRSAAVLEIGCGTGEMLGVFRDLGFRDVFGIDISSEQVEQAQKNGFNVMRVDALAYMNEHPDAYDIILGMDIIEHFTKEEVFELLAAVHYALKPGGLLVLQTPNGEGLLPGYVIFGDFTHFTIFSPLSLRHILTFMDFRDIQIKELGPGHIIHFPLFVAWQLIRLLAMTMKFIEVGRFQKHWTESIICTCHKSVWREDLSTE